MQDTIAALRELNENPDTIFTVITGEGRFFSAGADVKGEASNIDGLRIHEANNCLAVSSSAQEKYPNVATKKLAYLTRFTPGKG